MKRSFSSPTLFPNNGLAHLSLTERTRDFTTGEGLILERDRGTHDDSSTSSGSFGEGSFRNFFHRPLFLSPNLTISPPTTPATPPIAESKTGKPAVVGLLGNCPPPEAIVAPQTTHNSCSPALKRVPTDLSPEKKSSLFQSIYEGALVFAKVQKHQLPNIEKLKEVHKHQMSFRYGYWPMLIRAFHEGLFDTSITLFTQLCLSYFIQYNLPVVHILGRTITVQKACATIITLLRMTFSRLQLGEMQPMFVIPGTETTDVNETKNFINFSCYIAFPFSSVLLGLFLHYNVPLLPVFISLWAILLRINTENTFRVLERNTPQSQDINQRSSNIDISIRRGLRFCISNSLIYFTDLSFKPSVFTPGCIALLSCEILCVQVVHMLMSEEKSIENKKNEAAKQKEVKQKTD